MNLAQSKDSDISDNRREVRKCRQRYSREMLQRLEEEFAVKKFLLVIVYYLLILVKEKSSIDMLFSIF